MHLVLNPQVPSPLFGAALVGVRCSLATLVFGSLGMWLGDLFLPLDAHVYHHADWQAMVLSTMALGMLVMCLPACIFVCRHQCASFGVGAHGLMHVFGKVMMIAGMIAGFLAMSDSHGAGYDGHSLLAHVAMIAGMTAGGGLGYAIAFFTIVTVGRPVRRI